MQSRRRSLARSLCVIFMILFSLENVKKCALGGCTITSLRWPLRAAPFETLILAFEANSALSRENETKIVKITHSAIGYVSFGFGSTSPNCLIYYLYYKIFPI